MSQLTPRISPMGQAPIYPIGLRQSVCVTRDIQGRIIEMKFFTEERKSGIAENIFLSLFIMLGLSLVFLSRYGFSDDFSVIYYHYTSPGWGIQWEAMSGRPVYGALRQMMTYTIGSVSGFSWFRLLSVIFIALYAVLFCSYLRKNNLFNSLYERMTIAVGIAFLPAMQIYAAWAMTYPFALSLCLAFLSFLAVRRSRGNRRVNEGLGYFLLTLSFFIYQPCAMIFVFFVFFLALFDPSRKLSEIIRYGVILGAAMATNFLYVKIYTAYFGSTGRDGLEHHVFHKILWFINNPVAQSIQNYNIHRSALCGFLSALLILYGIWCTPRKIGFPVKIVLVFAFCLAIYAPNLIVAETSSPYRTLVGLETIFVVLFLNGLFHIFRANYRYAFPLVVFLIVFSADFNIEHYIIAPQQRQMAELAQALKSVPHGQPVDFDIRDVDSAAYSRFRRFEFGGLSIDNSWTPKGMAMAVIRNSHLGDIKLTDGILVSSPDTKGVYYLRMKLIRNLDY
ncbi:glucosyltransferase domain-containing protein [Asaia siamensis]|uniref:glucosyltransferase domain-containing protein n=2 Tax=Asaia TaxID=91914 RepID=UPI002FC32ACE